MKFNQTFTLDIEVCETISPDCNLEKAVTKITEMPLENIKAGSIKSCIADKPKLNDNFTFDNFVVGNSNKFAHAIAFATAQKPGNLYNPLFIYGGVGLGKTHLMQAIGHKIYEKDSSKRIIFISCEKLFNDYIESLQNKTTIEFRYRYRSSADIILIDDIQFLSGKERLQEEFFNMFNAFLEENKQIVMTSDKSPQQLQHIEDRLVSRFEFGSVTDIQCPDFETRIAIIKKIFDRFNVFFTDDICEYLANKIQNDIRKIEGAITKLTAYASIQNIPITLKFARECLKDYVQTKSISLLTIQKIVSEYYNINIEDLCSQKRSKNIAFPRQMSMSLCRDITDFSLAEIAMNFGGKDHATVLYACKKIETMKNEDHDFKMQFEILKQKIINIK